MGTRTGQRQAIKGPGPDSEREESGVRETTKGYGSISIMPGWSRRLVKQDWTLLDWTLDTRQACPSVATAAPSPLPPPPTAPLPPRPSQQPGTFCCFPCSGGGSGSGSGSGLRSAGWPGCLDGWARWLASCWPPCPGLGWRCKDRSGWIMEEVSVLCAAHTHTHNARTLTHTHTHTHTTRPHDGTPLHRRAGGGGEKN